MSAHPDLFACEDAASLIAAWYAWRKARDPSFSVRAFARAVGERNRTILHSVMRRGRRLTVEQALRWLPALGLDESESAFFLALVRLDEARAELHRLDARRRVWQGADADAQVALAAQQVETRVSELARSRPAQTAGGQAGRPCLRLWVEAGVAPDPALVLDGLRQRQTDLSRQGDAVPARPALFGLTEAVDSERIERLLAELRRARDALLAEAAAGPRWRVHWSLFPLSRRLTPAYPHVEAVPVASPPGEAAPSVLAWTDPGAGGALSYLAAWLAWRQRQDPSYGYARFAAECGQPDRAILWKVLHHKQRLTPLRARAFARGDGLPDHPGLGLDADETEILALLTARDRAEDAFGRALLQRQIDEFKVLSAASVLPLRRARLLSGWAPYAIHELALCDGFRPDPAWIAEALQGHVTPSEAEQALGMLFAAHMLEALPEGLRPTAERWQLDRPAQAVAPEGTLLRYHRAMADQEARAVRASLSGEVATPLLVGQVVVPAADGEVFRRLEALFERLQGLCATPGPRDRVVQVCLHGWPEAGEG